MKEKTEPAVTDQFLKSEAEKIYRAVFKKEIPPRIPWFYVNANRILLSPEEQCGLSFLKSKHIDLEALELVWRFKKANNLLTRKAHIILFLAEADPRHFTCFIPQQTRRFKAFFMLGFSLVRTLYKFIKGIILYRRYPVA